MTVCVTFRCGRQNYDKWSRQHFANDCYGDCREKQPVCKVKEKLAAECCYQQERADRQIQQTNTAGKYSRQIQQDVVAATAQQAPSEHSQIAVTPW